MGRTAWRQALDVEEISFQPPIPFLYVFGISNSTTCIGYFTNSVKRFPFPVAHSFQPSAPFLFYFLSVSVRFKYIININVPLNGARMPLSSSSSDRL
ncbi:hypothetical protein BX666DRAFT_1060024 [Dichotomocladium elegans]|nr:hypothetical protein BX666DRAFT_1060024 [Dichotomocladium elegans]